jgi:hypothetical protein
MPTPSPTDIAVNEAKAIATLRSIAVAQTAFKLAVDIDTNCDAVGEYGYFAELAGTVPMRVAVPGSCVPTNGVWGGDELDPPLLRSPLGRVMGNCVSFQGYRFQMWLPKPEFGGLAYVVA